MNNDALRRVILRVQSRAEAIYDDYEKADDLLKDTFRSALPWVTAYATKGKTPKCNQMLELAAQLVAIAAATSPPKVVE